MIYIEGSIESILNDTFTNLILYFSVDPINAFIEIAKRRAFYNKKCIFVTSSKNIDSENLNKQNT